MVSVQMELEVGRAVEGEQTDLGLSWTNGEAAQHPLDERQHFLIV